MCLQVTECIASKFFTFQCWLYWNTRISACSDGWQSTRGKKSDGRWCHVGVCLTWWSCMRNGRIPGSPNYGWTSPCCRSRILDLSLWNDWLAHCCSNTCGWEGMSKEKSSTCSRSSRYCMNKNTAPQPVEVCLGCPSPHSVVASAGETNVTACHSISRSSCLDRRTCSRNSSNFHFWTGAELRDMHSILIAHLVVAWLTSFSWSLFYWFLQHFDTHCDKTWQKCCRFPPPSVTDLLHLAPRSRMRGSVPPLPNTP
jgi:hypothetical protein